MLFNNLEKLIFFLFDQRKHLHIILPTNYQAHILEQPAKLFPWV